MKYLKKYNEKIDSFWNIKTDIDGLLVDIKDKNYYYKISANQGESYFSIYIKDETSYTFEIGNIFETIKTLKNYIIAKELKISYSYYCHLENGSEDDYQCVRVESIDTDAEIIDLHIYIEE